MIYIKIAEILSESIPQLALNLWTIRTYGIQDPIQIISAILSLISYFKGHTELIACIINGENRGIACWTFIKTFGDLSISFFCTSISFLLYLSESCLPSWGIFVTMVSYHPVAGWLCLATSNNPRLSWLSKLGTSPSTHHVDFFLISTFTVYYIYFIVST